MRTPRKNFMRKLTTVAAISTVLAISACSSNDDDDDDNSADETPGEETENPEPAGETSFTVRISNVATADTLQNAAPILLAPGAYIVHDADASPILGSGQPSTPELESMAEDGDPSGFPAAFAGSAVFNTPVGADAPGPIPAGGAYEFTVTGSPGDKVSFVTMLIQSNDWFYTPTDEDDSISLFDESGQPRSGDVSDEVALWDSGTEIDEEMGTGPNQPMGAAQMAGGPNTGPAEGVNVGSLAGMGKLEGFQGQLTDATAPIIRVELTPLP